MFPDYAREFGYKLKPDDPERFSTRLTAVDPGGAHVGVATFGKDAEGWACVWAHEFAPIEFEDWLSEHMLNGGIDVLVVEKFALFADKALEQTGSEMETAQLIGAIKFIHRACKSTAARWPRDDAELVFQPPSIKKPTLSVLRSRGLASVAKAMKAGGHALDAELHGYHHILRTLEEPVRVLDN